MRVLTPEQKARKAETNRARYAANKERIQAQVRAWKADNRDKCVGYGKKWELANPDKVKQNKLNQRAKARNA